MKREPEAVSAILSGSYETRPTQASGSGSAYPFESTLSFVDAMNNANVFPGVGHQVSSHGVLLLVVKGSYGFGI